MYGKGDKSKKNVYKKTMGFVHRDTTSVVEDFKANVDLLEARVKNTIQQSGLGKKEPHKSIGNGKFQRPTPSYKKDKYQGQVVGREMSTLSRYGNKSTMNMDPFAVRKARRKLVKGT
tara:strand:- start:371 stop:721 length:351 start_codon:yes stop_codon:yes gene_type:complete